MQGHRPSSLGDSLHCLPTAQASSFRAHSSTLHCTLRHSETCVASHAVWQLALSSPTTLPSACQSGTRFCRRTHFDKLCGLEETRDALVHQSRLPTSQDRHSTDEWTLHTASLPDQLGLLAVAFCSSKLPRTMPDLPDTLTRRLLFPAMAFCNAGERPWWSFETFLRCVFHDAIFRCIPQRVSFEPEARLC
jgi:hypothetical protein